MELSVATINRAGQYMLEAKKEALSTPTTMTLALNSNYFISIICLFTLPMSTLHLVLGLDIFFKHKYSFLSHYYLAVGG